MKRIYSIIDRVKYEYLDDFSSLILLFWTIAPLVEYFFKNYMYSLYKSYFVIAIYIIGVLGILEYLVYFIKQKREGLISKRKYLCEILIFILLIIGFIASIFSKNPRLSFLGEPYRKEGLVVYIMYIGFILSASLIMTDKNKVKLVKLIIFSALIIGIFPLFRDNFTYKAFTNIFNQFNHYGYFLMISLMLSIFMFINNKGLRKVFYLFTYIFLLYLLIRNDTFGCYLASSLSLIVLFVYSLVKRYQRISVIIAIVIFVLISFGVSHYDIKIGEKVNLKSTQGSVEKNITTFFDDVNKALNEDDSKTDKIGTGRGYLWKKALSYTMDHPIIGGGMECLYEYYHSQKIYYSDRPHNIILQISSFIGIPGALSYLALIIIIAFNNLKNIHKNPVNIMIYFTAMAYFISSMFGNSMYYTSPYFMILLGLLIGSYRENVRNNIKEH